MLDFEYYQNVYFGTKITSSNDFMRLVNRAKLYLDKRLTEIIDDDKYNKCLCELADAYYTEANAVVSETVGSWSRTYKEQNINNNLKQIVLDYYGGSGLLYRGQY